MLLAISTKKKKKKSVMDRLELLTTYDFLIKKNGPVMCAFKGYICALRVYITIYEKLKRPWKKLITFSFFYKKFKKWFTNNEYHKSSQKKKKMYTLKIYEKEKEKKTT